MESNFGQLVVTRWGVSVFVDADKNATVVKGRNSASIGCAIDTAWLDGGDGYELTPAQTQWLDGVRDRLSKAGRYV